MRESVATQNPSVDESVKTRRLEQSIERFVLLLAGIRFVFLFSGIAFALWKAAEVFLLGESLTINGLVEVLVVGLAVPGLLWVTTYWGEKQAREVVKARHDLAASTRLVRYESEQRSKIEIAQQKEDAALAEIGRLISSSLDIQEVYEGFAKQVRQLIPFQRISVGLINLEEETLSMAYVSGADVTARRSGEVIPLASTLSLHVATTRRGIIFQPQSVVTHKAQDGEYPQGATQTEYGVYVAVYKLLRARKKLRSNINYPLLYFGRLEEETQNCDQAKYKWEQ